MEKAPHQATGQRRPESNNAAHQTQTPAARFRPEFCKRLIFLADLTHTRRGIQALTFPLGTAYVAAYAKSVLGDDFAFSRV